MRREVNTNVEKSGTGAKLGENRGVYSYMNIQDLPDKFILK